MKLSRRSILENCIAGGVLTAGSTMSEAQLLAGWQRAERSAHQATPPNELGPFFRKGAPARAALRGPNDPGFPLQVSGKVWNTRGDVVPDARIEIWQADHEGHYDVLGYRYRARLKPGPAGEYKFESVMPGHYPDRVAQHVHYFVTAPGHKPLVTQLYFATDPVFKGEPARYFNADPLLDTPDLIRPVTLFEQGAAHAAVVFELCLERV